MLLILSKDGVALPKIIGIFLFFAIYIATSLALYFRPSCCLKETSCSSSIIIRPKSLKGVKIDDLVPIIIFLQPLYIEHQFMNFSFSVRPEWYWLTSEMLIKSSISWGTRLISGDNIATCLFFFKTFSHIFLYTSVLPLPVIPSRTKQLNF